MAKRGRKRLNKRYYDEEEERATILYLSTDDPVARNVIYEEFLKEPLHKMTESIINRYGFYSKEMSFDDLLNDTLSFLHTKIDKFDPDEGTKAYSYYGTIIKHYLMGKSMKEQKTLKKNENYDAILPSLIEDERYSYTIDEETNFSSDFFTEYVQILDSLLVENDRTDGTLLKKNEAKVGNAILGVMKNWEDFFEDGGSKYNKNQVLECLRNMTGLGTKDIRDNLKRFKVLYYQKKEELLKQELDIEENETPQQSNLPQKKKN